MAEVNRLMNRVKKSSQQLMGRVKPDVSSVQEIDYAAFIERLEMFADLTGRQRRRLVQLCIPRDYRQGEIVISKGDVGLGMFIIISGQMEVYLDDDEDAPRQVATYGAGETVGEMSLLDEQPRSANVRVVEDCHCLLLTRDGFKGIARQMPELVWGIVPVIVSRLRRATDSPDLMVPASPSDSGVSVESKPALSVRTTLPSCASGEETPGRPDCQDAGNCLVEVSSESPVEPIGGDSAPGLVAASFQVMSASFMLGSTMCIYGLQESARWTVGKESMSQKISQSEQLVSAVADTFEDNMNRESQNALSAFRTLLDSVTALFG